MSETILHCPCGKSVTYDNPCIGAINVGHCRQATGWYDLVNTYTGGCIWVCQDCLAQVKEGVQRIVDTVGTDNISIRGILP